MMIRMSHGFNISRTWDWILTIWAWGRKTGRCDFEFSLNFYHNLLIFFLNTSNFKFEQNHLVQIDLSTSPDWSIIYKAFFFSISLFVFLSSFLSFGLPVWIVMPEAGRLENPRDVKTLECHTTLLPVNISFHKNDV